MIHDDNAVTALAEAVARVGRHRFPVVLTDTGPGVPDRGLRRARHRARPGRTRSRRIAKLGTIAPIIGSTMRNTANPTRLAAGYKENVIPSRASATIDCRTLPGPARDASSTSCARWSGPDLEIEIVAAAAAAGDHVRRRRWSTRWRAALRAEDPGARPVPYMLSGGTDAKAFARLGIRCFGFTPLRLPPDLNFSALFHGIDERVPVEGLQFGVRVLDRLLADLLTIL